MGKEYYCDGELSGLDYPLVVEQYLLAHGTVVSTQVQGWTASIEQNEVDW